MTNGFRSVYNLLLIFMLLPLLSCGKVEIEGKEAPLFSVDNLSGGTISLADFKGKPVMLYWFAGW